jgi:cytochrome c oxidase subunit 4/cytochrome o ubiquinol oxidase operon protein cyoD
MADHASHNEHHVAHESHGTKFYWIIGAILAVVTALEVGIFLVESSMSEAVFLVILLGLALVKGAGVIAFFMHLRGDAKIFQFVFLVPLLFAFTFCIGMLKLFSNHVGIAG